MSNLIVFNQSCPCMFVRFNVKVECVKFGEELWRKDNSRLAHERPHEKHMLEAEESSARRHLVTKPTREMAHEMHCQPVLVCYTHFFTHAIKAHITHEIVRRLSERKP